MILLRPFSAPRLALLIAVVCLLQISPIGRNAYADVTWWGSVSPTPPGDGDVEATLIVGDSAADDPDTRAYLRIDGGTELEYEGLIVGDQEGYQGHMEISGSLTPGQQTRFRLEESGSSSHPTAQIGRNGYGRLIVENAASLEFEHASADMILGFNETGVGSVTVTGLFSIIAIPDTHIIGDEGIGYFEILDGATVHNTGSSRTATIGAAATGIGEVVVDGLGSAWRLANDLVVGGDGVGTLLIGESGLVDADDATTVGAAGRTVLNGGVLLSATIANNGYLGGSGLVGGAVTNGATAVIEAQDGQLLRFDGAMVNQGSVRIRGGEVEFLAAMANNAPTQALPSGRITLDEGRVRFATPLTNGGVIASTAGASHLHGEITNATTGALVVASDSVATFHDSVNVADGSLDLLAGANALFLADLIFETGSMAALEIAGDAFLSASSQIDVTGTATLAGELSVNKVGGFTPTLGDSIELLSAANGISGAFDTETLPPIGGGLAWDVRYEPSSVLLVVENATFAADFDGDGDVDGVDLTHPTLGWNVRFGNDLDGGDLLTWQRELGSGVAQSVATTNLPEPPSTVLLVVAIATLGWASRRHYS